MGRSSRGQVASMPLSPLTMMSRASSAVAPIRLTYCSPALIQYRTVSTPVRVFPNPRPAWMSQVVQSPEGIACSGRRHSSQQ